MTRNEALEILDHNWTRLVNPDYTDEELGKAQNMAIETLEQCEMAYEHGWTDAESKYREILEHKRGIWMPIEQGDKGYSAGDFICSCCGKPNKCYSVTDYCCSCGAEMEHD